ncbi:MAG: indolepyruvate ferredoxin oxidoreductase subunit alpha [Caldisphaeraceae archaeon]|nr:indolepyruvate ferredoxin oxidoreductase subunit alpha [Caldisphaeraceae archaeon]MEB3691552.1 indolepyruvate ferredoxin oxidoreductase subunit alpha [Caldisphaeraceae archaeon]MEB3797596.1 indolepyruvate ferredoxin oxidoreductase subunit alpha [Caldisphaeraceae archaeon]
MHKLLYKEGSNVLLLGNEAIARGFIEAGGGFAAAYPGTPSTEIVESLAEVSEAYGYYVEWSVNEKVALESAFGASISGVRSLAAMKHVGLNVAADAFASIGYVGTKAGLVIVSAEDPNMWSSQNEQDNRLYGMLAYIPVLEPSSPQEAKELTKAAFDLSEKIGHAVLMTPTTRVTHTRGPVTYERPMPVKRMGYFSKDPKKFTLIPSNSRSKRKVLPEKWEKIRDALEVLTPYNRIENQESGKVAIVASGISYPYVKEATEEIGKYRIIKISSPVPLPKKLILKGLEDVSRVLVVEELEPVVENQIRKYVDEEGLDVAIEGKNYVGYFGEMRLDRARKSIREFLGLPVPEKAYKSINIELPDRPPSLCPGCPHRATFYSLKRAVNSLRIKPIYSGDIGCYSLGINPPYNEQDIIIEMGGSIGVANGLSHVAEGQIPIAIIGDSTFYHAGVPPLINAVYNRAPMLVVVLDNRVTAMTGEQPNPGSGFNAIGAESEAIDIATLAKAIGVEKVIKFDPFDIGEATEALKEALSYVKEERRPAVAIAKKACALYAMRIARKRKVEVPIYQVIEDKCTACGICYNALACPAILVKDDKKAWIDPSLCTGCGVCAQVCPFDAIKPIKEIPKEWDEIWE